MRQNWLEWVVLGLSAALVVGVVGFLVVDGLTDLGRPPAPQAELQAGAAYEIPGGWVVPATVMNEGDSAAVELVMRATATVDGVDEESEVTIHFLPPGTDVDVSFGFSAEPEGEIEVTTVSFRLP